MAEEIAEMPAEITEEKVEEEPPPAPVTEEVTSEVPEPPKKRGRPKKETAPNPEPKARGRPRKVPQAEVREPQTPQAQAMEMSYEDMFSMLAARLHDEKTRKRDERLKTWDAFLPA
jgi:hypothetical protein